MEIDFSQRKAIVKYQILNSHKNIDKDSNEKLFEYYEQLIRWRHDLFHKIVLEVIGYEWTMEKSVASLLNLDNYPDYMNRTPDIFFKRNDCYYLIDVSVSINIHENEKKKYDKYQPIVNYINTNLKFESKFIHINVQSSLGNIEKEFQKIEDLIQNEVDYLFLTETIDIIELKMDWLDKFIDKSFFFLNKRKLVIYYYLETTN